MPSVPAILHEIKYKQPSHPHLLAVLVRELKHPSQKENYNLPKLIELLQADEASRVALTEYVRRVFQGKHLSYVLASSGIFHKTGFVAELIRKIKHSILPQLPEKDNFEYPLLMILSGRRDDFWLKHDVHDDDIARLFDLLDLKIDFSSPYLRTELFHAIEILSYRITATVLESEFIYTFRNEQKLQAFIKQNKEVHTLVAQHNLGVEFNPHLVTHLQHVLDEALHTILTFKKLSGKTGVSLQFTYTLHRLTQQIERMKLLFDLYLNPKVESKRLVSFIRHIVQQEKDKNRVMKQVNETIYLLAYQIAEHESKTGDHYITNNRKEYREFFYSSCGGGSIASAMTFMKLLLHHISFAPFWQAMAYGLNYASGFVIIQVTHSTLATKQPAMTASKIAHSLDRKNSSQASIPGLALMIGKVWRSQFISFVGNLLLIFPLSLAIAAGYHMFTGHHMVNEKEAFQMLHDVHPWKNPTWFYASITGVFLFISGIISGYYDNKVIYSSIPKRIREHQGLRRVIPKRSLVRFSRYVEHNMGSLIGNIALGFFLGTAAFIGYIFGLPFDIRHITISSGNYSIAMFSLFHKIQWSYAIICLIGVLGIGVFNFLISFGLALFVAAKSRRVKASQFYDLVKWTWLYFKKYPKDFFFPPKQERTIEDLVNKSE